MPVPGGRPYACVHRRLFHGVPALVAGYSVKARGIARDLFGTEEGHVVPVQSLDGPDELRNAFVRMMGKGKGNQEDIRESASRVSGTAARLPGKNLNPW